MAVFRSFKGCIQTQASATLARSVLDGTFEGLAINKVWRRQSSADSAARAVKDLCAQNKVWNTGMASITRTERRRVPRCCDGGRGTPRPR